MYYIWRDKVDVDKYSIGIKFDDGKTIELCRLCKEYAEILGINTNIDPGEIKQVEISITVL